MVKSGDHPERFQDQMSNRVRKHSADSSRWPGMTGTALLSLKIRGIRTDKKGSGKGMKGVQGE